MGRSNDAEMALPASNRGDNKAMAYLPKLPTETQHQIGSECSSNDLQALCCTSKFLNKIYTELLYRDVDLSENRIPDKYTRFGQQTWFIKTVKDCPDYAKHVRSLKWTLIIIRDIDSYFPIYPTYSDDERLGMWEILATLSNVSEVFLSESYIGGYIRPDVPEGLDLFPKATAISLSGEMEKVCACSVVSGNIANQLEHLHMNMVFLDGKGGDLHDITTTFLTSLTGNCIRLKSLSIIHWNFNLFSDDGKRYDMTSAYIQLAVSVKETIESLYFEIKGDWQRIPSMERNMEEIHGLLAQGSWPRLRQKTVLPAIPKPLKLKSKLDEAP